MQRQTLDKSYRQSLIEYNAPPDFTYCGVKIYLLNLRSFKFRTVKPSTSQFRK